MWQVVVGPAPVVRLVLQTLRVGGRPGLVFQDMHDAQRHAAPHGLDGGPLDSGQGFLGTVGPGDYWRGHHTASLLGRLTAG